MTDFADISAWQTNADLTAYKQAGYKLISLRATDGATYKDATFPGRWQQAAQLGLRRLVYHFARPGDPKAQAQALLGQVHAAGGWRPDDLVMLDCEWFTVAALERLTLNPEKPVSGHWRAGDPENGVTSNAVNASLGVKGMKVLRDRRSLAYVGLNPADALAFARSWFAAVEADNPDAEKILYGNEWYVKAAGITEQSLPDVGTITAAYGSSYQVPPGFSHSCGWQFTDSADVPGISGGCDLNHITCTSDPAFAHLETGDISMADAAEILKAVDFLTNAVGERMDSQDKAIAEISQTVHSVGNILEYGTADRVKHPAGDGHYGFKQVQAAITALQADVAAIKAALTDKDGA